MNLICSHAMCDFELESINSYNQRNPLCELTGQFPRTISQKYPTTTFICQNIWNQFIRIIGNVPRSNNVVEG
ncbi:hypothetical protein HZS_4317 [Henneguya salminicola]|nr:hypothetical protein HZS_4317 [Henneguya salminicola]